MARRGGLGRGLDALIPDRRSGKPANSIHDMAEEGSDKNAENPVRETLPDSTEAGIDESLKEGSDEVSGEHSEEASEMTSEDSSGGNFQGVSENNFDEAKEGIPSDNFESNSNGSGEGSFGEMSEGSFKDPNATGIVEEGNPGGGYSSRDNSEGAYPEGDNPEATDLSGDNHEGAYPTENSPEGTYPMEGNPEGAYQLEDNPEGSYPTEGNHQANYPKDESSEAENAEAFSQEESYTDFEAAEGESSEIRNDQVVKMRLSLVEPNREQPRKYFDDQAIEELSDSIRQFGIIQPLLVQKKEDYFEIIAGERRWRAAKKAGLKEVPVIVKNFSNQEAVEVSLIENIQREDLNPIEEAKAYDRLVREYGLSQEAVAGRVSKSRSSVTNSMRLLKLEPSVQQMVETGQISEGHARAILGLPAPSVQKEMAEQVIKAHLSVRQTEKMVRDIVHPKAAPEEKEKNKEMLDEAVLQDIEEKLKLSLGTRVRINQSGKKGGRIEIEYYSFDDLDRLFELLRSAHEV